MTHSAPRTASDEGVIAAAEAALGSLILEVKDQADEITLTVQRDGVADACRLLRDTPGLEYQQLMEIAGVDYPENPERFEVNYHLLSLTRNRRIRVKVRTDETTPVPTVTTLWPVAGWLEREVFDLYGVTFAGNADLRRILTDYGFEGYPLRKDFPLTGYTEMRYSEAEKRVVYEPVSLAQDFRTFDFLTPWNGPEYRLPGDEKAEPGAPGGASPAPATAAPPKVEAGQGCWPARRREAVQHRQRGPENRRHGRSLGRGAQVNGEKSAQLGGKATDDGRAGPRQQESSKRDPRRRGGAVMAISEENGVAVDEARQTTRVEVGVLPERGDQNLGDEAIQNYTINFGPQHPAAHGVLRLIMELDGEIVERCDPHVGLLHRGTEKLIEYKTYAQAIPYFDRLDYCSPMCMEHSFVLAAEKLMGLEVPIRAQYIRVMMAELTRIKNHMLNLGSHVMDVGAMTPNLWMFELREDLMQIYESVSGARMHANYFRVGGVHQDIAPKTFDEIGTFLDKRLQLFEDAISLVADNRIFKQRNVDIATVTKEDAIALGLLGPDDPRLGHPVGHPQVAALRGLRPDGVRRAGRHARRLLRPLHGPGRRGPAELAHRPPVPERDARGRDRHRATARCSRPSGPR